MLTGKAKEMFEVWYFSLSNAMGLNYGTINLTMNRFYCLPESMQWGVYQDWANSLGFELCIIWIENFCYSADITEINKQRSMLWEGEFNTRQEARNAAIEKLNEIINKA